MKKLIPLSILLTLFFLSCEKDDGPDVITQGDYPVKEYFLERDPSVNVWGAGMDFIHAECIQETTSLDYEYLTSDSGFPFDIKFYIVKAYYTDNVGDTQVEGCPALLLGSGITACKIGEGVSYFDSLAIVTREMTGLLKPDPAIDYEACKNEDDNYDRALLFEAFSQCVIGNSFRSNVLTIPDGMTEQEVQPVYLVKTCEEGYVKFMVKQFKGDPPNQKQTLVRWQVISE